MSLLSLITIFAFLSGPSDFNEQADMLLNERVVNGKVNYRALADNPQPLNSLYQQIGEVSLAGASDNEKKAFYINAYNIITIYQIVQHYPVSSPMDIEGFFDKKEHQVAGKSLTLNELEKGVLFKNYPDPRLHFVLVCAAESCPPLPSNAFRAESLVNELQSKTRQALNNPDFIKVDQAKKQVRLSKIFEWYRADFTENYASLLAYVNQYRDEKIPSDYKVSFYEYDWALNEK